MEKNGQVLTASETEMFIIAISKSYPNYNYLNVLLPQHEKNEETNTKQIYKIKLKRGWEGFKNNNTICLNIGRYEAITVNKNSNNRTISLLYGKQPFSRMQNPLVNVVVWLDT